MANTAVINERAIEGVNAVTYATLTLSSTYATGGETVTASQFGLAAIKNIIVDVTTASTDVIVGFYVPSTGKILLRDATGAQVANATSLTGVTLNVRVLGS